MLAALLLVTLTLFTLPARAYEAPKFTSGTELPDAMQGVYYSTRIKASGSNPLTFSFAPGDYTAHSVPKGLTMNQEGLIYGTPQKPGTYKFVVEAADKAARASIQVHGAMGYSWEVDVHLFLKRALALTYIWGTPEFHRARIAARMFSQPMGPDQTFAREA